MKTKDKIKTKLTTKERFKKFGLFLKNEIFTKRMIVCVIIAEVIFWSPCIVSGILAVTVDPWWWTVFSAVCLFWASPFFTPAVPLQIALAFLIRKIWDKIRRKRNEKQNRA